MARARLTGSGDGLAAPTHDARLLQGPVRTCVGCRERALRSVLLRVIVSEVDGRLSAVPDPDRRSAGRGAWLHPDPACLDAAERRKAFPRAFRRPGPVDSGPLREYLAVARRSPSGQVPDEAHSAKPS